MRRGMLCSLLLTAALLLALPTVWQSVESGGARVSDRLRPARQQPLTVWLIEDRTDSLRLLRREIAAFEKANEGARVYLRNADANELFAADAVLPDVVLFSALPEGALLPMAGDLGCRTDAVSAGMSSGELYAVPLWYAPGVLCVPAEWLTSAPAATATATPFFALGTPLPTSAVQPLATEAPPTVPWDVVAERLDATEGVALLQAVSSCPVKLRPALISTLQAQFDADGRLRVAGGSGAYMTTLAGYRKAVSAGAAIVGFPLFPAATDRVLYLGFAKASPLAEAFLGRLLSRETQAMLDEYGLFPTREGVAPAVRDRLTGELEALYEGALLFPNAFAHVRGELNELCRAGLAGDPAEALLRLR